MSDKFDYIKDAKEGFAIFLEKNEINMYKLNTGEKIYLITQFLYKFSETLELSDQEISEHTIPLVVELIEFYVPGISKQEIFAELVRVRMMAQKIDAEMSSHKINKEQFKQETDFDVDTIQQNATPVKAGDKEFLAFDGNVKKTIN